MPVFRGRVFGGFERTIFWENVTFFWLSGPTSEPSSQNSKYPLRSFRSNIGSWFLHTPDNCFYTKVNSIAQIAQTAQICSNVISPGDLQKQSLENWMCSAATYRGINACEPRQFLVVETGILNSTDEHPEDWTLTRIHFSSNLLELIHA